MNFVRALIAGAIALSWLGSAQALEMSKTGDKVDAAIISSFDGVNPHQNIEFLVRFKMKDGWHIFAQNPGEIGMPTQIEWQLPRGYEVLEESWSQDESFENEGIIQHGYGDTAYYKTTVRPHPEILRQAPIGLKVKWLACREECVPGHAFFEMNFPLTQQDLAPTPQWTAELAAAQRWFFPESRQPVYWGAVLVLAFLGGLILNFMPCILPILTIKAITLAQSSHDRRKNRAEALFYTLGVVASFLIAATILLLLRLNGEYVGWGFQLQSPAFVGLMIVIFVVIALMLLDVVTFSNPLANAAGRMSFRNHLISSFMTGFFAVLIASPCTAPFMGIAIGYTLTAPVFVYYPVFLSLGLGYALPFALIHLYPRPIHKILPKPGKWMNVLKKIFAVPVILTCLWLGWVLYAQVAGIKTEASETLNWQPYSQAAVERHLQNKEPVFIDFTAKWCLTCVINKKGALQSDEFERLVRKNKINLFTADWTNNDKAVAAALARYGRNSIPLYVYYDGKSDDYLLLPQLLTPQILNDYLQ